MISPDLAIQELAQMVLAMRREQAAFNASVMAVLLREELTTEEEFKAFRTQVAAITDQKLAEADEEYLKEFLELHPDLKPFLPQENTDAKEGRTDGPAELHEQG